jgi:Lectin C-type domain
MFFHPSRNGIRHLRFVLDFGKGRHPNNGNNYYLLNPTTWADAQSQAVGLGGNLVTIHDATENQWIVNTIQPIPNLNSLIVPDVGGLLTVWTGINDIVQEGNFVWASGQPVTYTNWAPGEPNNLVDGNEDWGMIYPFNGATWQAGQWNDAVTVPNHARPAFVEVAVPEPSSLLLVPFALCLLNRRNRKAV